jgi:ribosomal protein S18 acetylase RimI-like enzyme
LEIEYLVNQEISADEFIALLQRSTLAARRPVEDRECIEGMLKNANLLVTAWKNDRLIGVARSVTDFTYCCYLSDLAVDVEYQKSGIGRQLIAETQNRLGPRCAIILLSAPAAVEYYPRIGLQHHPQAWILPREKKVEE